MGWDSARLNSTEQKLMKDLDIFLQYEEAFWFQKARDKWINLGD